MRNALLINYAYCTGCHTCEVACQKEKGLGPEQFGIKLTQIGPDQIEERKWQYEFIPVPTDRCDRCVERTESGMRARLMLTEKDTLKKAMTYYYREGKIDLVKKVYDEKLYSEEEYKAFEKYVTDLGENKADKIIGLVGKVKGADTTAMEEDWRSTLPTKVEVEVEEEGLETWAICLIIAGAVVVVAAAIIIPVIILGKKKAKREAQEAITNAYKRPKIDTTDDKTIDVYADDAEEETPAEEAVEAVVEEVVEEATEAAVEEVSEAPAEEASEEKTEE
jgi:ferredoxin